MQSASSTPQKDLNAVVWFYVDDGLAFHPKTIQAGNAAMGLWVRAGAWSTGSLTDGFIPDAIAASIGTPLQVSKLGGTGLWQRCSGGYLFHDWDHRQLSKAEVEQRRKTDRARKAEQRRGRNVPPGHPPGLPLGLLTESTGDTLLDSSHAVPQGCVPHPSPPLEGGGLENVTHHAEHPGPPPCPKHPNGNTNDEPCRNCRRIREYNEIQRGLRSAALRQFWADVETCKACSPKGWIETDLAAERCPHHNWAVLE